MEIYGRVGNTNTESGNSFTASVAGIFSASGPSRQEMAAMNVSSLFPSRKHTSAASRAASKPACPITFSAFSSARTTPRRSLSDT